MVEKVLECGSEQFEDDVIETRAEFTLNYEGIFSSFFVLLKRYRCRGPPLIGLKFLEKF